MLFIGLQQCPNEFLINVTIRIYRLPYMTLRYSGGYQFPLPFKKCAFAVLQKQWRCWQVYQNVHQRTQIFCECWRFYSDTPYWIVSSHLAETRLHWVHSVHSLCNDLEYSSSSTLPLFSLCCLHRTVSASLMFLFSILEQPMPTLLT